MAYFTGGRRKMGLLITFVTRYNGNYNVPTYTAITVFIFYYNYTSHTRESFHIRSALLLSPIT